MVLLREFNNSVQLLTEEAQSPSKPKRYYVEGIFMQCDVVNRNGRSYPMEVVEPEVNRYVKEYVETKRAFAEFGHPEGPKINEERISHRIVELKRDGNNFYGKALISNSPLGKIVQVLLEEDGQLAVSSRAIGSLRQINGVDVVQKDFYLACAGDIVVDPSAPDAFVRGLMESKEWVWDNGILKAVELENYKKQVEAASRRKLEETKIRLFEDFLKQISTKTVL